MKELTIGYEWILEHKTFIPWHLFVGAEIVTESGQSINVIEVTERSWPTGPLINVSFGKDHPKQCMYNIQGFQNGFLRTVKFKAPLAEDLQSLVSRVESDRNACLLAEKEKQVAVAAAIKIALELQLAAAQASFLRQQTQDALHLERQRQIAKERQKFDESRMAQEIQRRAARIQLLKQKMLEKQESDSRAIAELVEIRRIPYLIHFTRIENLTSIMELGIVSRTELPPGSVTNDLARFDEFLEASCLTVGYPNWSMFYKYQCQDRDANWAAFTVSPDALTTLPCLFHPSNAASAQFRDKSDQALESRMALNGLQAMFYDEPEGLRADRCLASYWTTDPQAEVLVFETIPVRLLTSVVLLRPNVGAVSTMAKLAPSMKYSVGGKLFSPRPDYSYW